MMVPSSSRRRHFGAVALGFALLGIPCGYLDAQVKPVSAINSLPRYALVIGNSKYEEAPLKNPGNDARALAGELTKMGFKVDLRLDATRAQMIDAIRTYSARLAEEKA